MLSAAPPSCCAGDFRSSNNESDAKRIQSELMFASQRRPAAANSVAFIHRVSEAVDPPISIRCLSLTGYLLEACSKTSTWDHGIHAASGRMRTPRPTDAAAQSPQPSASALQFDHIGDEVHDWTAQLYSGSAALRSNQLGRLLRVSRFRRPLKTLACRAS